jgi:nitrogen fixation protein FixH
MRSVKFVTGIVVLLTTAAFAQTGQPPPAKAAAPMITFTTQPTPAKGGADNLFEVSVKDVKGQPVSDADVSVTLVMPAMPAMNMAEMRNVVTLKSAGTGKYSGKGQVMMAGTWNVTVTAKKAGKPIGEKKTTLLAQ